MFKKFKQPQKPGRQPLLPDMAVGEKFFTNTAFSTLKAAALRIQQRTGQEFAFEKIKNGYVTMKIK